jgi:hypothetical protein
MNKLLPVFFVLLLLAFGCKKKNSIPASPDMANLPQEFRRFYDKFHADSVYQLKHIQFPLQGLPSDVDSATLVDKDFYFTQDVWKLHQLVDFNTGEFSQSIKPLTERMVVEQIFKSDNSFAIERRFAKLSDNEWYLIYYIAPNRFSKIQK